MTIGKRIKKIRNEKAMTQSELAGTFITRNMLSLIESGNAQPSLPTIQYLAERLNVPAGILIEDDKYEYLYRRAASVENIRHAYAAENYRICLDLCQGLEGSVEDDEINLIRAECCIAIAKEEFSEGHLKHACKNFDKACEYSKKTLYNTSRIVAEAYVYCNYMQDIISPSLFADCVDEDIVYELALSDEFCRYACCFLNKKSNIESCSELFKNKIYDDHIKSVSAIKKGDYEIAYKLLIDILNGNNSVPSPIMYDVFKELEVCCKEIGDFKGAYEYSCNKVIMMEKFLADEVF